MKWVDNHKGVFTVQLQSVSTIHTQVRKSVTLGIIIIVVKSFAKVCPDAVRQKNIYIC